MVVLVPEIKMIHGASISCHYSKHYNKIDYPKNQIKQKEDFVQFVCKHVVTLLLALLVLKTLKELHHLSEHLNVFRAVQLSDVDVCFQLCRE